MAMRADAPELAAILPEAAVAAAKQGWLTSVHTTIFSNLHRQVANCLKGMGCSFTIEQQTTDRCFSVDIALVPRDWEERLPRHVRPCLVIAHRGRPWRPLKPAETTRQHSPRGGREQNSVRNAGHGLSWPALSAMAG